MTLPHPNSPEFAAAFVEALARRAAGPPLRVELQADVAGLVVGALQLALRHPDLPELTRREIEPFVRLLIEGVCDTAAGGGQTPAAAAGAAVIRRGLDAGFDPQYSTPTEPATADDQTAALVRAMPESWREGLALALRGGAFRGELVPSRGQAVWVYLVAQGYGDRIDRCLSEAIGPAEGETT